MKIFKINFLTSALKYGHQATASSNAGAPIIGCSKSRTLNSDVTISRPAESKFKNLPRKKNFRWNDVFELKLEKYLGRVDYSSIIAYTKSVIEIYHHRKLSGNAPVNHNEHEDSDNLTNDSGYVVGDKDLELIRELSDAVVAHTSVDFLLFSLGFNKDELEVYLDCYGGNQGPEDPERSPSSLEATISFVISSWEAVDDGKERLSPQEKRVVLYKKSSEINLESEEFPRLYLQSIEAVYSTSSIAPSQLKTFVLAKLMPIMDSLCDKARKKIANMLHDLIKNGCDLNDHILWFIYGKLECRAVFTVKAMELLLINEIFMGDASSHLSNDTGTEFASAYEIPDYIRGACRSYVNYNRCTTHKTIKLFFQNLSKIRNSRSLLAKNKDKSRFQSITSELLRCYSESRPASAVVELTNYIEKFRGNENYQFLVPELESYIKEIIEPASPIDVFKESMLHGRPDNRDRIIGYIFEYSKSYNPLYISFVFTNKAIVSLPHISKIYVFYEVFNRHWIDKYNCDAIVRWINEHSSTDYRFYMLGCLLYLIDKYEYLNSELDKQRCNGSWGNISGHNSNGNWDAPRCNSLANGRDPIGRETCANSKDLIDLDDYVRMYTDCFSEFSSHLAKFRNILEFSPALCSLYGFNLYLCELFQKATSLDMSGVWRFDEPEDSAEHRNIVFKLLDLIKSCKNEKTKNWVDNAIVSTMKKLVMQDSRGVQPPMSVFLSVNYIIIALLYENKSLVAIYRRYLQKNDAFFSYLMLNYFKEICKTLSRTVTDENRRSAYSRIFGTKSGELEKRVLKMLKEYDIKNYSYLGSLRHVWQFKKKVIEFAHFFLEIDFHLGINVTNDEISAKMTTNLLLILDRYLGAIFGDHRPIKSREDYIVAFSTLLSIEEIRNKRYLELCYQGVG